MEELKKKYTDEIRNHNKAFEWLEEVREGIRTVTDATMWEAELKYKRILINIELLQLEFKKLGYTMTDQESKCGFEEVK